MPRWIHPAWKTLGIAPISDTRAIRVAYSAKLKAIDPDKDPAAFIELREAFEAAKVQAQWVDQQTDDEDDDEAWDGETAFEPDADDYHIRPLVHAADGEPSALADEPTSPWAPIRPADADAHAHALATLLYSNDREHEPHPTDEQTEAMLAHWRAIAADPRMHEIAYFADADRWFSELIARTVPFADPLVIPVTRHFGWTRSDGAIAQSHAVAHVTRRYRMLEFLDAVKTPKHPLNQAWHELTTLATERSRRGRVDGRRVRELLGTVRAYYPDMEGCFDAMRVALWDATAQSGGGGGLNLNWIGPALFIGFFVLRALGSLSSSPSSSYEPGNQPRVEYPRSTSGYTPPVYIPPPTDFAPNGNPPTTFPFPSTGTPPPMPVPYRSGELEIADPDLDQALEQLFGSTLDIATIALRKPDLHKALKQFWNREHAAGVTKARFALDLRLFLDRRYPAGVQKGELALFAD